MEGPLQALRQPGSRDGVPQRAGLRDHPRERPALQGRPDEREASRLGARGNGPPGGERLDPVMEKSKNFLHVVYSNGVRGRVVSYDLATGKAHEVKLPASGTVWSQRPGWRTTRCTSYVTSWISPTTRYDFDAGKETFAKSIFNTDVVYPGFEALVSDEVEVPGHDGTMVPLSIVRARTSPRRQQQLHPGRLRRVRHQHAPHFNMRHSIASRGVVAASAHPRGGSEKGEAWYKAGYKTTKPNTWKDFIACAEYLVKKGYTRPEQLTGTGTSAGGILISRAVTEAPRPLSRRHLQRRLRQCHAHGVHPQRPGQHPGVRNRHRPRRMRGALRDGRRPARAPGRHLPRRPRRRRLERPARRSLANREIRRRPPEREHPGPPAHA